MAKGAKCFDFTIHLFLNAKKSLVGHPPISAVSICLSVNTHSKFTNNKHDSNSKAFTAGVVQAEDDVSKVRRNIWEQPFPWTTTEGPGNSSIP